MWLTSPSLYIGYIIILNPIFIIGLGSLECMACKDLSPYSRRGGGGQSALVCGTLVWHPGMAPWCGISLPCTAFYTPGEGWVHGYSFPQERGQDPRGPTPVSPPWVCSQVCVCALALLRGR